MNLNYIESSDFMSFLNKSKQFDVFFSLGPACRPAYYLQLCDLRKCAYPMDWQICSMQNALHFYKTGFVDFFDEYEDLSKEKQETLKNFRYVVDKKYNVTAMHHISANDPLELAVSNFKTLIIKRYERLMQHLNDANSIFILANHTVETKEFVKFLEDFSKLFPGKKITLVNIYSTTKKKLKTIRRIAKNVYFIQHYFNDVYGEVTDGKPNPKAWIGNEEKWLKILSKYSYTNK